ncbi:IS66 family insertion sequence element accessory protein TnpA [Pontibacter mangrovi]
MKRPTSPAQMQAHVTAWQQSGLTQKEYCRQHQLTAHLSPQAGASAQL